MPTSTARGFTLIELLVVIAIIGILSAVILASLSGAKSKGNDAAAESDLHSIQTEAELYWDENGYYGSSPTNTSLSHCTLGMFAPPPAGDQTLVNAINNAVSDEGGGVLCSISPNAYAVEVQITSIASPTTYWCVDSTGYSGPDTTALTKGVYNCP